MANINRSVISSKIRQWGGLPLTYLHDNAAYAQSAVAMAPLKEAGIDVFENKSYPPYSPDLNPIENAWALVKRAAHRRQPKTMTALRRAVHEAWEEVMTPEYRQALIDSMPNRLRAVNDAKGGSTKYQSILIMFPYVIIVKFMFCEKLNISLCVIYYVCVCL
jgi:hypothetical protein